MEEREEVREQRNVVDPTFVVRPCQWMLDINEGKLLPAVRLGDIPDPTKARTRPSGGTHILLWMLYAA